MKDQTSQEYHREYTNREPHEKVHTSENIDESPNFSKVSSEFELSCGSLKNSTLRKISMKDQTSQEFYVEYVLSVDL